MVKLVEISRRVAGFAGLAWLIVLICSCSVFSDTMYISEEVIDDVVGSATVVVDESEETNGDLSMEVRYIVLDLAITDPRKAVAEELKRLGELEWQGGRYDKEGAAKAYSEEKNAVAKIVTLDDFLASGGANGVDIRKAVSEKVRDPAGLIVVTVQPRRYSE